MCVLVKLVFGYCIYVLISFFEKDSRESKLIMERAKHSFLLCPILLSCLVMNKVCLNQSIEYEDIGSCFYDLTLSRYILGEPYNSDLFWNHKWKSAQRRVLCTKITEVNLSAIVYRSPVD